MTNIPGRLLVVDDVEMNRDLLARRLRQQGHAVETAENGREALERLRREEFDLVLLDVMMPEMDGYQVLEELRADERLRGLPVIMVSALNEIESVVRCIEAGAEDYLPKPFNPVILRARVEATLEKKRLRDQERLYAKSLERELEIGRNIQASFLPETIPQPAGWEVAACLEPARTVGGDVYDAFTLPGGRLGLVVADVCDKGVGAALFVALFRSLLRVTAERLDAGGGSMADVVHGAVTLTNDYIARTHGRANMFATVFFAVLDPESGALVWLNGGHEPAIVRRADGRLERLEPTGGAVGLVEGAEFGFAEASLEPGDVLVAFTDGVTDARNPSREFFGEPRLLALAEGDAASAAALLAAIQSAVAAFAAGAPASDDIAILVARRSGPRP